LILFQNDTFENSFQQIASPEYTVRNTVTVAILPKSNLFMSYVCTPAVGRIYLAAPFRELGLSTKRKDSK
jgi:hypothetical protein